MISERGKGRYTNKFGMRDFISWYKLKRFDIYVDVTFDFVEDESYWMEVRQGRTYGENTYEGNHLYGRWKNNPKSDRYDEVREFKVNAPSAPRNPDTSTRDKTLVGSLLL